MNNTPEGAREWSNIQQILLKVFLCRIIDETEIQLLNKNQKISKIIFGNI